MLYINNSYKEIVNKKAETVGCIYPHCQCRVSRLRSDDGRLERIRKMLKMEVGKTYRTIKNLKVKITRNEGGSDSDFFKGIRYYGVTQDDLDNEAPMYWSETGNCFTLLTPVNEFKIIAEWHDIKLALGHHYKTVDDDVLLYYSSETTITETTAGKKEEAIYKFLNENDGKTYEYCKDRLGDLLPLFTKESVNPYHFYIVEEIG